MKLQEYINEMKPDFHRLYGERFQFDASQTEAHMDLTLNACTQYLQKLAMSGKLKEVQDLATGGADALKNSSFYIDLLNTCAQSYYGLDWENFRKIQLAEKILTFILDGLKYKFIEGGYSMDQAGVMKFLGLDLGILGKMSGMFGRFFR
jgi:hypothetical protein